MANYTDSILAVQNALVTICTTIEDPNNLGEYANAGKTQAECDFASGLPFFWVRRGRLLNRQRNGRLMGYTRQYQLLLYVAALCGDEFPDEAQYDLALAWIIPVLNFFSCLFSVTGTGAEIIDIRDTGDSTLAAGKEGKKYAGVAFTLSVRTTHEV